jgi:DMSO/TMAO reductase YedYZ molybdopterin-dependent catalytic subunit
VSTRAIGGLASIKPETKFVMVHGAGGFSTNLSLPDFFSEDVLFAVNHDGKGLSTEHGAPVRLVVPRLYFWKSAKWVTGVEFLAENRPGFWERNGYHMHGDPWKEERYSSS